MKLILFSLGVAVISLTFPSCQKEIHFDTPAIVNNGGTVLSKYVELDTTLSAGQDTLATYTFAYDNLKRIKRIYQVRNFPGYNTSYYITTDFFYNSSDAMPYKTIEVDQEDITYVDTSFYSYQNGFVSSDSSINYSTDNNEFLFTNVILFAVSGNNVSARFKETYPNSVYQDSATLTVTRQNGDILSQQDPDNTITNDLQRKYDNKVDPFYNTDIHYPIIYEHLFNSFSAQKNNLIDEVAFTNLVNPKQHLQYSYSYRSDGYPLTVKRNNLLRPSEDRKGLFFYTN
jgi:hypothetical protein